MSEKITFISSADHKYFPMLREWIHSIRRFPESHGLDICILDVGMTEEQLATIRPLVTVIKPADWPKKIPAHRIRGRDFIKACVNRPFLKDIFPGYDIYFWMDADTWVQRWQPVEYFIEGARRGKMSLTSQSDRAYPKGMRVKWLGDWPWKVRGFYFTNARMAFGRDMARKLFPFHVVLAGAFCLHKDAPHWAKWQELILKALEKGKPFTAEQLTLGIMIHLEKLPAEVMPAWCHWLCEFKPKWDAANKCWVEPFLPHEGLGILHLSGYDRMRIDRSDTTDFQTLDGKTIQMTYRYPWFNGETGEETSPEREVQLKNAAQAVTATGNRQEP